MTRKQGYMSFDLFKKIIDEYVQITPPPDIEKQQTLWLHHFGESLLSPIFDKALIYARERGLRVGLSFNPMVLTDEKIVRLVDAKPYELYVMMDGNDEESFAATRGVDGVFERSKENALKLIDYNKTKGNPSKIKITAINIPTNQESILAAKDYWSAIDGVDCFLLKPFATFAEGKDGLDVSGGSDNVFRCTFPWTVLNVAWDGAVSPCCYDYNIKYPLGNVCHESLMDIWNGEPIISLRNEFDNYRITNELCKPCEFGGGFDDITEKSSKHNLAMP
jgi:radical SAM protein with 4Fe4S-binding SPASM domain